MITLICIGTVISCAAGKPMAVSMPGRTAMGVVATVRV